MTEYSTPAPARFLRRPEVSALVGLQRAALYQRIKAGDFPRPVRIGPRAVAWIESEIAEWQASRLRTTPKAGA